MSGHPNKARPDCYPPGESGVDIQSDGGAIRYGPRFGDGAGKGCKRRPGSSEAYRRGWDRIFGKIEPRPGLDFDTAVNLVLREHGETLRELGDI